MSQHTPGPWDIQNKGDLYGKSGRVEVVAGRNLENEKNLPKIVRMPDLSERSYANARLIAAAPDFRDELQADADLFEEAANLLADVGLGKESETFIQRAIRLRALLAKVEGK